MMNLLHTIGLMRRAEHEAKVSLLNDTIDTIRTLSESRGEERNELLAKFKRAATDLAAQADKLAMLEKLNVILLEANADLRPDAEAMRRKRAADRKRMAGKRGAK